MDPDPNPDTDSDLDPIRIQGFDEQKLKKKNTGESFFNFIFIKNCYLLIPKPP